MTLEIVDSFNNLAIRRASLKAVFAESQSKVALRLSFEDVERKLLNVCELQFTGVADVVVDAIGTPWFGQITKFSAMPNANAAAPGMPIDTPLTLFVIDSDKAHFEVIAERYSLAVLQRIPIVPQRET